MRSVTWSFFFVPFDLDLHTFFVSKPPAASRSSSDQIQKAALLFPKISNKTSQKKN